MKNTLLILAGVLSVGVVVYGIRFGAKQSEQNEIANLASLKQLADSGASLEELLLKAVDFQYVLNKVTADSADGKNLKPENTMEWDHASSLTESTIAQLGKIQTGELELRRKAGGYFLTLRIVHGRIESSKESYPPGD